MSQSVVDPQTAVLLALDPLHFPQLHNVRQRLIEGTPHPENPVLRPRPGQWDGTRCKVYGTVLVDPRDGLFKMWYSGGTDTEDAIRRECGSPRNLGYAFSEDGIRWTRPNLGLIEYNGSRDNNLIMLDAQAPSVFLLEDAPAAERFMMITEAGQHTNENYILFSADGVNWNRKPRPPVDSGDWGAKTHEPFSILFDPKDLNPVRRWKGYSLLHIFDNGYRGRAVGYFEAADPQRWVEPPRQPIMSAFEGMESEIHIPHVSRFHDTYVMLYDAMEPNHHTQAEVAVSDDAVNFRRVQSGVKLIPNGPPGSVNAGKVCVSPRSLFTHQGKIWWYHTVSCDTYQTCPRGLRGSPWYRYTNLVQWREDGFARLEAAGAQGRVTSAPLRLADERLETVWVNAAAPAGAAVTVEVLAADGQVVGVTRPWTGDGTRATLQWRGEIPRLPRGGAFRLRLHVEGGAAVYAVGVAGATRDPSPPPQSQPPPSPRAIEGPARGVRWSFAAGKKITAAPVIAGELILCTSWDHHVYALDCKTGLPQWKFKTANAVVSTPAVHGDVAYVASRDGNVYALDLATGELKWKSPVHDGRKFNGFNPNGAWIDCTPTVAPYAPRWAVMARDEQGNRIRKLEPEAPHWLFVGAHDRQMHAFDLATGHEMWRTPTFNWILSRPAVDGYTVYFGCMDGHLYALDAQCGALKWRYRAGRHLKYAPQVVPGSVVCEAVCGSPLVEDGTVYFGGDDGFMYALDAATGEERWAFATGKWIWGKPVRFGDVLCFASADQHVYGLDAKTGSRRWKTRTGNANYADVAERRGQALVACTDGNLYALDPATGRIAWSFDAGAGLRAAPAVADDGRIYLGNCAGRLLCIDRED